MSNPIVDILTALQILLDKAQGLGALASACKASCKANEEVVEEHCAIDLRFDEYVRVIQALVSAIETQQVRADGVLERALGGVPAPQAMIDDLLAHVSMLESQTCAAAGIQRYACTYDPETIDAIWNIAETLLYDDLLATLAFFERRRLGLPEELQLRSLSELAHLGLMREHEHGVWHVSMVHALLFATPAQLNVCDDRGWTPLMIASEKGSDIFVPALLALPAARGLDVNAAGACRITALMLALENGTHGVVSPLVFDARTDLNAQDVNGRTALMRSMHHRTFRTLLSVPVERGLNVNARDVEGRTALHILSSKACKILLKSPHARSIDMNVLNLYGHTPLHDACRFLHFYDKLKVLLKAPTDLGLDLNARSAAGFTPLMLAIKNELVCAQRVLLSQKSRLDLEARDPSGNRIADSLTTNADAVYSDSDDRDIDSDDRDSD